MSESENSAPPQDDPAAAVLADPEHLKTLVNVVRDRVKDRQRELDRGKKALDSLARKTTLDNIARLEDASGTLREIDFASLGLGDARDDVVEAAESLAGELRRTARQRILPELRERAAEVGAGFDLIGDSPPVVVLSPCTVTLDTERGRAIVRYAREEVKSSTLTADSVISAWQSAKKAIKDQSVPSEVFFERLHAAYEMTRAASNLGPGERVDIVDLLGPMAVLSRDMADWRRDNKFAPYPRYLLAFQLARLRRDNLLERGGRRIVLGTATGGSTRNKRNVLFVPVSVTDGQYYLSLAFASRG